MTLAYQNQTLPKEKVFRDPIHTYVHVQSQVIWDLINAKEFQRLRRIKQLGTSSFTFHGAEHTYEWGRGRLFLLVRFDFDKLSS